LACLLTSSYNYDVVDATELANAVAADEEDAANQTPSKQLGRSTSGSDVDIEIASTKESGSGVADVSMFLEDEDDLVAGVDDDDDMEGDESKQNTNSNDKGGGGPRQRWKNRFGRGRDNSSTPNRRDSERSSNSESSKSLRLRMKLASKAQKKLRLATKRHYQRRYMTACQLLQSSCNHLLLESDISKPMYEELEPQLEALKAPRIVASSIAASGKTPLKRSRWGSQLSGASTSGGNSSSDSDDDETKQAGGDSSNNTGDKECKTPEKQGGGGGRQDNHYQLTKLQQQQFLTQSEWMTEYDAVLAEHLPQLSPGAGYRCLCWLLFQHLLHANKRGYDARARYAFKSLAVAVLTQDIERTLNYTGDDYVAWKVKNYTTWVSFATRKFEKVEHGMADRLLKLAQQSAESANNKNPYESDGNQSPAVSLEDIEDELDADEVKVVSVTKNKKRMSKARKQLVRGLKIGGVGVVAGTLLAVTGGMAAPAIAGALTFLGMGAVAGTFLTLASTTAVVHIFGVAGGSLAAYKMRRRTAGLTEFNIVQSSTTLSNNKDNTKEKDPLQEGEADLPQQQQQAQPRLAKWRDKAKAFKNRRTGQSGNSSDATKINPDAPPDRAELSRTICVSGWLIEKTDFQRPWGLTPTQPPCKKVEKLQRFYRIYNPDLIPVCDNLLKRWKKEESTFWELLEDKYGSNPDTLFPLKYGPMHDASLTEAETYLLDKLLVEIGEARGKQKESEHANLPDHVHSAIAGGGRSQDELAFDSGFNDEIEDGSETFMPPTDTTASLALEDDIHSIPSTNSKTTSKREAKVEAPSPNHHQRQCYASVFEQVAPSSSLEKLIPPEHLTTVWDFSSRYGGEVYTVHWEAGMLMKLCLCLRDVALTATASAGQQALRLMVANSLAMMAAVPVYVVQAMNAIDETWSLVVERADQAGQELARSLLINQAGHRPVTLVGYSFGARVIFSCLKQLALYQQQWEQYHEDKHSRAIGFAHHSEEEKKSRKEKKWMLAELEFDREPASVVEDVVLMGTPLYLKLSSWRACRQVVAGRFVNVYSRQDKILSLMFKYKQMLESFKPVCGNCTVAVPGVENVDVSDMINNHQEYVLKVGDILKRVRHGQPVRSSSNALDEEALIAEAETLAAAQQKTAEEEGRRFAEIEVKKPPSMSTDTGQQEATDKAP
jgi:hypothetical protein